MSSRPSRGAARLASILDALPDALLLVDVNGTIVNANSIAIETFESPGTALVGRGLLDLLPSFDSKRIPGSMRSAREAEEDTRTKPTRMVARRTDGSEFPVEVTSANLEDPRTAYGDIGDPQPAPPRYTGDELLMLVVRDLTGTLDTEAELARQQRQTEMILRAAAEGVVGVDTAGKVVLVNPSAAQILGHRATDLGGKELHPLVHHSRRDGSPLPYEETPLADTLRSGRKHRVRGQVLWRKDGRAVPVDLTTAPVRDGDQLVGAVMTFTDRTAYDALAARTLQLRALLDTSLRGPLAELRGELTGLAADPAGQLWPEANQILHHLSAGYARITTLIDNVLAFQRLDRGEDKLRRETIGLDEVVTAAVEGAVELIGPGRAQFAVHAPPIEASVDPERMAQALAHLVADVAGVDSAGNAIAYSGDSTIVVAAAQRGDVIRIDVRGPHAGGDPVHLPLARGIVERHGGVLQTHEVPGGSAYVLEVPVDGGGPRQKNGSDGAARNAADARTGTGTGSRSGAGAASGTHAGVGPGTGAGAHAGGGTDPADRSRESETTVMPVPSEPMRGSGERMRGTTGRRTDAEPGDGTDAAPGAGQDGPRAPRPRQAPEDSSGAAVAPWAIPVAPDQDAAPTGRRRALRRPGGETPQGNGGPAREIAPVEGAQPTGRRARRARPEEPAQGQQGGAGQLALPQAGLPAEGLPQSALPQDGPAGLSQAQHLPQPQMQQLPQLPQDRIPHALPHVLPPVQPSPGQDPRQDSRQDPHRDPRHDPRQDPRQLPAPEAGTGRRARRALEPAAPDGGAPAVPPQAHAPEPQHWPDAGTPEAGPHAAPEEDRPDGRGGAEPVPPRAPEPQSWPTPGQVQQSPQQPAWPAAPQQPQPSAPAAGPDQPAAAPAPQAPQAPQSPQAPAASATGPARPHQGQQGHQSQGQQGQGQGQQDPSQSSHGRAISVRTLGQGMPFGQQQGDPQTQTQAVQAQTNLPAQVTASGSGRRRRLSPPQGQQPQSVPAPPQQQQQQQAQAQQTQQEQHGPGGETQARQHPQADPDSGQLPIRRPDAQQAHHAHQARQSAAAPETDDRETALLRPVPAEGPMPEQGQVPGPAQAPAPVQRSREANGRAYAIGAPAEGAAEGPEPLDGPNGAVDVTDIADDRLEESFDEPRRLLVWPEPDVSTRQALTDRGYRPVIVRSREEVDAQIAEPPAALFVDPLTGPITRTALQSLRQAAAAADVPVLVTAGLGQATREAAYGADPAVLLKALAPRDSEQHPPRVLLVESHDPIAQAFAATLERRGMQVSHADSETDAMTKAAQVHPNLVVMDLMLIRRRRQGIVDWLRGNARLNNTPLVVYTSADIDPAELPRLASGETVLFLAERSTSTDVQARIVDLLGKIGA
ncbi:PAS domain-containing protein [Actinacidiphila alni]|uniref:PAS domain-containing protein n=1 Tax=Actinacidiphila alni TaxID=380248 RepID=UPI0034512CF6